jgi:hypothetical protein
VFGSNELVELLQGCGGLSPAEVADRVESAVLTASDGKLRDDVAILAFGPTHQPAEEPGILPGGHGTEEWNG